MKVKIVAVFNIKRKLYDYFFSYASNSGEVIYNKIKPN